jgi:hypothetical protein
MAGVEVLIDLKVDLLTAGVGAVFRPSPPSNTFGCGMYEMNFWLTPPGSIFVRRGSHAAP